MGQKDFKFTAKFPKVITHDKRLKEVDEELEHFFDVMGPLENKMLALLIQLPPSFQIHKGLENLRELVPQLDNRFRYAIEERHPSWFQDLSYSFFANNDICLVWSQLAELQTPPVITTDFVYMRLLVTEVFKKRILVGYKSTGLQRCRSGQIILRISKRIGVLN